MILNEPWNRSKPQSLNPLDYRVLEALQNGPLGVRKITQAVNDKYGSKVNESSVSGLLKKMRKRNMVANVEKIWVLI